MKKLELSEDTVSMFLGLAIVVVVVGLIFNFVQRSRGNIDVPGISIDKTVELNKKVEPNNKTSETENVYVVKKGDSMWQIAVVNLGDGFKWTEIAKLNNISNPSMIYAGDKLKMPVMEAKTADITNNSESAQKLNQPQAGGSYQVVKGDNLWKIAVRAYADGYQWTKIWQTNKTKIIDPNKLEIGMILSLPVNAESGANMLE